MNHSKRYVLPLVALCVLLVGAQAAFGQATLVLGSNPTRLRAEGITEASGAITFSNSTNTTQTIPALTTVTIVFDVAVTSPGPPVVSALALDTAAIANIFMGGAVAPAGALNTFICTGAGAPAGCTGGVVQTSNTIQFVVQNALGIPAGDSLNITGIRLNASQVAAGTAINGTVTTTPPNAITFPSGGNATVVGRTQTTLAPIVLTNLAAGVAPNGGGVTFNAGTATPDTFTNAPPVVTHNPVVGATVTIAKGYSSVGIGLVQCSLLSSATSTSSTKAFNVAAGAANIPSVAVGVGVTVSEPSNFPGAFTTGPDEAFLTPVPNAGGIVNGGVTKGIELTFNYTGLVAGTTLYVPNVINNIGAGVGGTIAQATASETWVLQSNPGTTTSANVANITGKDLTGFAASSSGAVTIGYALVSDVGSSSTTVEATTFPVVFSVTSGTPVALGSFGTVSVSVGRVDTSSSSTTIIRFAANASPAVSSLFNVTPCSTNLLFPYVTSTGGFVTAVAISNTNADGSSTATPPGIGTTLGLPGGITLRFFGTGVPAAAAGGAGVALAIPAISTSGSVAVAGVVGPGEFTSFLSTDVAPGFTGYMIATCNFLFAHGFTLVTNGFGTPGFPVGGVYLPLIISNPRNFGVTPSSAAPEVVGH